MVRIQFVILSIALLHGCATDPNAPGLDIRDRNGDQTRVVFDYVPTMAFDFAGAGPTYLDSVRRYRAIQEAFFELKLSPQELAVGRFPASTDYYLGRQQLHLKFAATQIDATYAGYQEVGAPSAFEYEQLSSIGVVSRTLSFTGVSTGGDWFFWCTSSSGDRRDACTHSLADLLFALKANADYRKQSDERFEETLRIYGDPSTRPPLPEEARRYDVQARAAVEEKRFADASYGFIQVLHIAPWWSDAYFNGALVLGEMGQYSDAIRGMKRFLRLAPNDPQARTAQDQIYRWEAKVQ